MMPGMTTGLHPTPPTAFGRRLWGARAAPLRFLNENAPRMPARIRTGLFETSSDVNTCTGAVQRLIQCLDTAVAQEMLRRYPGTTFLTTGGMIAKCAAGGETNASFAAGGDVTGVVNVCAPPAFNADNTLYIQWIGFRNDFQSFLDDWNGSLGILSADAYRKCQAFGVEANLWVDRWKENRVPATCDKVGAAAGINDTVGQILTIVKWTAVGLVAVGFVFALKSV